MNIDQLIHSHAWWCADVGRNVNLCGTQATCASVHGCERAWPTDCPLFRVFWLKTTAWHWGLSR